MERTSELKDTLLAVAVLSLAAYVSVMLTAAVGFIVWLDNLPV